MQVFEDNIKQFPLTMEIEKSLRQFESALHAVSVIEGITSDLIGSSETKMTLLTNDQFKRTEKGMIVLTCSMVCQQCPQFSSIPSANRLKFLHWFYNQFSLIYRSEMTVKKFTDPESSYAVIIPGGYVDFNNLEYIIDIENLEQRKQFTKAFCFRHFEFGSKKYRPLNICRLEFASLIGLLFWNSVERILTDFIDEKIYSTKRDQLYAELHAIITKNIIECNLCSNNSFTNNFPPSSILDESSIRFGRLLDLLSYMTIFSWENAEVFQMAKIFMDLPDMWDEIILPDNTK